MILAHSQAATALETIAAIEAAAGRTQGNDFANLLSAANQENADLRSRISELENELVRQSRDSATKVDGLAMQAAKENASLVQQIVELEKRLQQMSQDMQALSESRAADLAQYEHKLKLAEASASSNSDFSAEKSAADSRFQELLKLSELAVEDLKSRLRAADTAILEASERESLLLAQKSELDADILSLRSLVDELRCGSQSQWSDYNEKSAMELALEEESKNLRAQLESQLGDFQGIMDAKDHIIEQLTEQVKKQQHQLEDAQAVNQVNSNTIVSQSSIIGKLQSQVDQSSNSNAAQNVVTAKPLEVLMELEVLEQENNSLKVDIANKNASERRLSEEVEFLRNRMAELERQASSDTRELEALHAETLHMRSLCLDLEAKCNSDAQVLSSLQREKQLLVMQNSQLLTMQPSMRNSRSSFESKGELAQFNQRRSHDMDQRRSHDMDQALSIAHGARRSSPHFFEPSQQSSAYHSGTFAPLGGGGSQNLSRASPTFSVSENSVSSVYDVPVAIPVRVGLNRDGSHAFRPREFIDNRDQIELYHA